MEKYLKLITKNNIYRHTNVIQSETDINDGYSYNLSSMKNFVFYSKQKMDTNLNTKHLFNEIINIKPEYDKIFVLIQFDDNQKNNINYVLNKFNSKTESNKDMKKELNFIYNLKIYLLSSSTGVILY